MNKKTLLLTLPHLGPVLAIATIVITRFIFTLRHGWESAITYLSILEMDWPLGAIFSSGIILSNTIYLIVTIVKWAQLNNTHPSRLVNAECWFGCLSFIFMVLVATNIMPPEAMEETSLKYIPHDAATFLFYVFNTIYNLLLVAVARRVCDCRRKAKKTCRKCYRIYALAVAVVVACISFVVFYTLAMKLNDSLQKLVGKQILKLIWISMTTGVDVSTQLSGYGIAEHEILEKIFLYRTMATIFQSFAACLSSFAPSVNAEYFTNFVDYMEKYGTVTLQTQQPSERKQNVKMHLIENEC